MRKNVVLVYPPKLEGYTTFTGDVSLALLYLSGAARNHGVDVHIFDFNTPNGAGKTLADLIDMVRTKTGGDTVIGINCLFTALFPTVRDIAKALKREFPGIKIITGGMHPTLFAQEIIEHCPEIDAVAMGESDETLPLLLDYLYGEQDASRLSGVCLRIDGKAVILPKQGYIANLDTLPMPGYEFFNLNEYATDTSKWWSPDGIPISSVQLPLLTSRSCPNQCNFCSMWRVMGKRFRYRSAQSVFDEIRHVHDTYGINYFKVADDNFTLNRERAAQICQMIIDSGMKLYFDTPNGLSIKTLDEELVNLMRRAGFIIASLAVESGSDYIRNEIMGKRISREQIINAFRWCRQAGMQVKGFFIVGMPEETEETIQETISLISEIEATLFYVNVARPMPGTRLFEQCKQDGLFTETAFNSGEGLETLWTGEYEAESLKRETFYLKRIINSADRHFWIRPYNLSVERLVQLDRELQALAYEKGKAWVDRIKRNNNL